MLIRHFNTHPHSVLDWNQISFTWRKNLLAKMKIMIINSRLFFERGWYNLIMSFLLFTPCKLTRIPWTPVSLLVVAPNSRSHGPRKNVDRNHHWRQHGNLLPELLWSWTTPTYSSSLFAYPTKSLISPTRASLEDHRSAVGIFLYAGSTRFDSSSAICRSASRTRHHAWADRENMKFHSAYLHTTNDIGLTYHERQPSDPPTLQL